MAFNKVKEILKNLQEKPEEDRRMIMQITIVVVSVVLAIVWMGISYRALNNLTREKLRGQIHFDEFKKEFDENNFGK